MSRVEFRTGDKVTHYREGDNVGVVARVRRPWWAFFGRVYWVQWREGVLPVLMHTGLQHVSDAQQVEASERA